MQCQPSCLCPLSLYYPLVSHLAHPQTVYSPLYLATSLPPPFHSLGASLSVPLPCTYMMSSVHLAASSAGYGALNTGRQALYSGTHLSCLYITTVRGVTRWFGETACRSGVCLHLMFLCLRACVKGSDRGGEVSERQAGGRDSEGRQGKEKNLHHSPTPSSWAEKSIATLHFRGQFTPFVRV